MNIYKWKKGMHVHQQDRKDKWEFKRDFKEKEWKTEYLRMTEFCAYVCVSVSESDGESAWCVYVRVR